MENDIVANFLTFTFQVASQLVKPFIMSLWAAPDFGLYNVAPTMMDDNQIHAPRIRIDFGEQIATTLAYNQWYPFSPPLVSIRLNTTSAYSTGGGLNEYQA